jgi:hypothetical protein
MRSRQSSAPKSTESPMRALIGGWNTSGLP